MAKKTSAVLVALLIVTYMCFPVLSVFAEDGTFIEPEAAATSGVTLGASFGGSQNKDCVYDFDGLREWLEENNRSGKTVTFGDTITIPGDISGMFMYGVTLDTMEYGLIIEGNVKLFGVKITGGGDEPVVTIASGGRLFINEKQSQIAATGAGGSAVKIESGGDFSIADGAWCVIRAEGVGVDAEDGLALSYANILSGDTGVRAGGDVEISMCCIDAAVPVETDGAVFLDTCFVNKPVAGAAVTNRKITEVEEFYRENLYHMLALGDDIPPDWFDDEITVILDDEVLQTIPVSWDTSVIDTNTAGKYEVDGTILAPYDRFGLDSEFPITATVEVVDASIPVFYEILALRGLIYNLNFLYAADDLSGLTLWRSDDEGTEWYDYTQDAEMNLDENTLMLTFRGIVEHPVWLVFEVDGIGESQILCITWDDDGMHAERGGDRNGGDRGENTLPPMTVNPPSDDDEPETGGQDGENPEPPSTTPPSTTPPSTTPPSTTPPSTTPPSTTPPSTTPPSTTPPSTTPPSTTSPDRTSSTQDNTYEPAEMIEAGEAAAPVIPPEADEIYAGAPSVTANGTAQPPPSSANPAEAAEIEPESQDTATLSPDTISEANAAVQAMTAAPIDQDADGTENAGEPKPYSDSVIPIIGVGAVSLAGAGAYLGFAGKWSLKTLIKLLVKWP